MDAFSGAFDWLVNGTGRAPEQVGVTFYTAEPKVDPDDLREAYGGLNDAYDY